MIQVFTDGVLIYDSRAEGQELDVLKIVHRLNAGGTATITMPPGHPGYNRFVGYRTIVTIYRDGKLRFRGRALYPDDTAYKQRTVTCEGEMCLLRDGISRPYSYSGTPADIFTAVIGEYNAQVEGFKRFTVGVITVAQGGSTQTWPINGTVNTNGSALRIRSGPSTAHSIVGRLSPGARVSIQEVTTENGSRWGRVSKGWISMDWVLLDAEGDGTVSLESENAETTLATVKKLVDKYGGYITFSDAPDGSRQINWLATLDSKSTQPIEFGENLLDFSSTGSNNTDLATGIIPYGAKDEKTKKRLTIESVNNGKDYIIAEDAREVRGTIMATVTFDDVTNASTLLSKAQALLASRKVYVTSLELTALDLSYLDRDIDSFELGDWVPVRAAPYGFDEEFELTQMTEDLLKPQSSRIILGKDIPSLTGADVSGDDQAKNAVEFTNLSSAQTFATQTTVAAMAAEIAQLRELIKALEDTA